ncbi:hypothetical protein C0W44_19125 [Photobacterium leiognathi subsp. mandapamensis]|nr:hypothetical protein C0W44_19125 [Photobacterium leiognathi subsp. mandapamensis]
MKGLSFLLLIGLITSTNSYAISKFTFAQQTWMNRSLFCLQQINGYLEGKERLDPMVAYAVRDFDKERQNIMLLRKILHTPSAESLRQYCEYHQQVDYPSS